MVFLRNKWTSSRTSVAARFSIIGKSNLSDKINAITSKQQLCQFNCMDVPHRRLTKRIEKRLDRNYSRILRAKFYKSWKQHHTKMQLHGHLNPISKTIQIS